MKILRKGVAAPKGFQANGLWCGIKRSGKPDLALIFSNVPAVSAGVFTKNSIKAAPLMVTQKHLGNNQAQAIIINSGNANCFTGSFGLTYAQRMANVTASKLSIKTKDVLVASTGIIGKVLPIKKIEKAIPELVKGLNAKGGLLAAKGILTTDTMTKEIAIQLRLGGKNVTLGACAKGSGMIEPNMATMLAFITTDVAIHATMLKKALKTAVEDTFNMITVDGCMSTNDMVTIMANGEAKNKTIATMGEDYNKFYNALRAICLFLAKKIVLDGEGATKFIEINVKGAKNLKQAKTIAKAIANSNLVKTAAFGSNPNWGRVAAAVGATGAKVTEKDLRIHCDSFKKKETQITVELYLGDAQATVYTSDLSFDYVKINAKYN